MSDFNERNHIEFNVEHWAREHNGPNLPCVNVVTETLGDITFLTLNNRDEVNQVIAQLQAAAETAFGPDHSENDE